MKTPYLNCKVSSPVWEHIQDLLDILLSRFRYLHEILNLSMPYGLSYRIHPVAAGPLRFSVYTLLREDPEISPGIYQGASKHSVLGS